MLAGKKPFVGETLSDTVAAILKEEPNWRALPPDAPARIRSLIARCLRKDPGQRLRDVADGRFQIEEAMNDPGVTSAATPVRSVRAWAGWIAAAFFLGTTWILLIRPSAAVPSRESISFPVYPPEKAEFSARGDITFDVPSFALSPDGRALGFSAAAPGTSPRLWLPVAARHVVRS
jgi:serine/threonine-protein kinase